MTRFLLSTLFLLLTACSGSGDDTQPSSTQAVPDESTRLNTWLDEQFAQMLDFSPQWKTYLGEKSDYDKLDDVSEAALDKQLAWYTDSVAAMKTRFNYALLDDEARTSYELWEYSWQDAVRAAKFRRNNFIFSRGGPHAELANFLINFHRVDTPADMDAYISRLQALPVVLNEYLDRQRRAVEDGVRQPQFDYDFALNEITRVTTGFPFTATGSSPLWTDIQTKLAALQQAGSVSAAQVDSYKGLAEAVLRDEVQPAYAAVQSWLQQDRAAAPVAQLGAWTLPDGEAFYNERLHAMTSTDMSADQIHELGLSEMARIRSEMETIKNSVGFTGTLSEFFKFMREDKQFYFPNTDAGRAAYLDLARDYLSGVEALVPDYFGILPKAGLIVKRVEAFREQDGAAQHYYPGSVDGTRPGIFDAHLSDMNAMPKYQLEDVAYHEGIPGHHMQISIMQELTSIPRFRTQYDNTAYIEGWGLYAERLAKEMGFFKDPYSDFGRLVGENWRAVRLVVDTGIHAKHWTQEQAVQYFLQNSPQPETTVRSEIQRYIEWPGQATAYKIGMMKFLELRENAKAALGDRFDIRDYHNTVLGGGPLPLPLLETRVKRWLERVNGEGLSVSTD